MNARHEHLQSSQGPAASASAASGAATREPGHAGRPGRSAGRSSLRRRSRLRRHDPIQQPGRAGADNGCEAAFGAVTMKEASEILRKAVEALPAAPSVIVDEWRALNNAVSQDWSWAAVQGVAMPRPTFDAGRCRWPQCAEECAHEHAPFAINISTGARREIIPVAQPQEPSAHNAGVAGSSPAGDTISIGALWAQERWGR